MGVATEEEEKDTLWETNSSEARAVVRLQSPCSCRCFGSRISMFSIHCKVLKVGWYKKEVKSIPDQYWWGGETGGHASEKTPSSPWEYSRRLNHSSKVARSAGSAGHALSPLVMFNWPVYRTGNVSPYTTWLLGGLWGYLKVCSRGIELQSAGKCVANQSGRSPGKRTGSLII